MNSFDLAIWSFDLTIFVYCFTTIKLLGELGRDLS